MSEVISVEPGRPSLHFRERAIRRGLRRLRRRTRDPGLCHGQVLALGALDERVAEGNHARRRPRNFSTLSTSSTDTAPSPTSPTSRSPSSASPSSPPSSSPTSSAGMARSAPPATRTSRRAATTHPSFEDAASAPALYRETIESLFAAYEAISQKTFEYLAGITPRPAE